MMAVVLALAVGSLIALLSGTVPRPALIKLFMCLDRFLLAMLRVVDSSVGARPAVIKMYTPNQTSKAFIRRLRRVIWSLTERDR